MKIYVKRMSTPCTYLRMLPKARPQLKAKWNSYNKGLPFKVYFRITLLIIIPVNLYIVEAVLKDHHIGYENVVYQDRRFLVTGSLILKVRSSANVRAFNTHDTGGLLWQCVWSFRFLPTLTKQGAVPLLLFSLPYSNHSPCIETLSALFCDVRMIPPQQQKHRLLNQLTSATSKNPN